MAATLIMAQGAFANSSDVRRGLDSKYTISGSDLVQIKRTGQMNLKRVIRRRLSDKLPKNAKLDSVTVFAKAVGPANGLDLQVGRDVEDDAVLHWSPPVCKTKKVKKVITDRKGRKKEVIKPERVCTKATPQVKKVVLSNFSRGKAKAWLLTADLDIVVSKVVVNTTIPITYSTEREYLGTKKANKGFGSSKKFQLNGQVDSIHVAASKENITLSEVVVYFDDGSSVNVPNVHKKVSKSSSGVIVTVSKPYKYATSVKVTANSRKLFGSRGKMNISVDYITSNID